jgi:hypothetical protein
MRKSSKLQAVNEANFEDGGDILKMGARRKKLKG